jgi:hypothetical protein
VRRLCVLAAFVAFATAGNAAAGAPPTGATARCNDGTYSFSQHRSGTCSHHGGVATWLAASATGTSSPDVGSTVLLAPRSRTSGCRLGALPDRRCSPGAYYSGLSSAVICAAGFHTGSIRNVPESEKHAVELEYGLSPRAYGSTLEIDHIVSLELGGSNAIANLFPEEATLPGRAPGYHAKDRLENRLHAMVCRGEMTLSAARRQIAANWEASYRRLFGAAP